MQRNYLAEQLTASRNQRNQRRSDRKNAAQQANAGMNFAPGNFIGYDARAQGGVGFDAKDAAYIKSQGGTKEDVAAAKAAYYDGGGQQRQNVVNERKRIKSLGTMDAQTQGISEYDAGKKFGVQDFKYLEKQGYTKDQIAQEFANRGQKLNKTMGNYFADAGQLDTVGGNKRVKALRKAKAFQDGSGSGGGDVNNSNNGNNSGNTTDSNNTNISDSGNTNVSDSGNTDNSINDSMNDNRDQSSTFGDVDQNVGNQNTYTMNNSGTINAGAGSNIGNFDYSVTIGQNGVQGNNNSEGGGADGSANGAWEGPLANLQYTAAYKALADNDFARSQSQMSGVGRAGQSIEQYDALGYGSIAANAYNMVGQMAQASRDRADIQSAFYMGDYFGTNPGPGNNWGGIASPTRPEDKTEEIAAGFNP